ncbi:MAG: hypothetical protein H7Y22_14415 [Gemmatimonadaceae bacterium]|nr:hypothetical protein [Gloeobacterales cyanobacterium ES-bin-141]
MRAASCFAQARRPHPGQAQGNLPRAEYLRVAGAGFGSTHGNWQGPDIRVSAWAKLTSGSILHKATPLDLPDIGQEVTQLSAVAPKSQDAGWKMARK